MRSRGAKSSRIAGGWMLLGAISRREFVRVVTIAGAGVVARGPRPLALGGVLRVGVIAASDRATTGIDIGIEEAARTAALFGWRVESVVERVTGADAAASAARRLLESRGAGALIAALDVGACVATARVTSQRGAALLNVACADDQLRGERCARRMFHVAASDTMRLDALLDWARPSARGQRWLIVAPPTPAARALADRARHALAAVGASAGDATSDPDKAAMAAGETRVDVILSVLNGAAHDALLAAHRARGGAALVASTAAQDARATTDVPRAWPELWHPTVEKFGGAQLNDRFRARAGRPMRSDDWAGWVAAKIVWEAAQRAASGDARAVLSALERPDVQFDGHKGRPLSFRPWDHQMRQPLYVVSMPGAGARSAHAESVVEVPQSGGSGSTSSRDVLDRLGIGASQTRCRLGE